MGEKRQTFQGGGIVRRDARKLKRPDGELNEEFHTATTHLFENGELTMNESDADGGSYTGRFWFEFKNGKVTRLYTTDNAPKWLLALYYEAIVMK